MDNIYFVLKKRLLKVARRLKRTLTGSVGDGGEFNGNVEGMSDDGTLRGWVYHRATLKGRVAVGLYARDTVLETGYADRGRRDVAAVHGCDSECGFMFTLSDRMFETVQKEGGSVSLRTIGKHEQILGAIEMQIDTSDPAPHQGDVRACRFALREYLEDLDALLVGAPEGPLPKLVQPPFEHHDKMFTTNQIIPDVPMSGQPAYMDYVRYRYRMDDTY